MTTQGKEWSREFTVFEDEWARGSLIGRAYSINGMRCCLGHLCDEIGIPDDVDSRRAYAPVEGLLWPITLHSYPVLAEIGRVNDDGSISDDVRKEMLVKLFKKRHITVHFKPGRRPR